MSASQTLKNHGGGTAGLVTCTPLLAHGEVGLAKPDFLAGGFFIFYFRFL